MKRFWGNILQVAVFALLVAFFWLGPMSGSDAMGFALVSLYICLPLSALISGFHAARRRDLPAVGLTVILALALGVACQSVTFDLANTLTTGNRNLPSLEPGIPSVLCAPLGLCLGFVFSAIKKHTEKRKKDV